MSPSPLRYPLRWSIERLEAMGSNVLLIRPGYSRMHGVRTNQNVVNLTWDDAREIEIESGVISLAVPTFSAPGSAEYRDRNWQTRVTGATASYFAINNETLAEGNPFSEHEVAQRSRVAVLGDTVWNELFDRYGSRVRQSEIGHYRVRQRRTKPVGNVGSETRRAEGIPGHVQSDSDKRQRRRILRAPAQAGQAGKATRSGAFVG